VASKVLPVIPKEVKFEKPVAIIYNPAGGGRMGKIEALLEDLKEREISYELLSTTHAYHGFELALKLEQDRYSALLGFGGDGTFYELVNGLHQKEEGQQIPLGLIPGGTGNDAIRNFYISEQ